MMLPNKEEIKNNISHYPTEEILVISREILFENYQPWQGLKECDDTILNRIISKHEYHNRAEMEVDARYKQIIPYFIFMYNDSLFLMQRGSKGNEKRLSGKFTLGIGGHVRKEDVANQNLIKWGMREFEEEVNYSGKYTIKPYGIINDDSDFIGQVHLGLVYLVKGDSSAISINQELAWGELLHHTKCYDYYPNMEKWSQFVIDTIYPNWSIKMKMQQNVLITD